MTSHELVLQCHPGGGGQILIDGHDLSMIVQEGGVTLAWDHGRPVVTITVMPDRIQLDGVAAEFVEALMVDGEKRAEDNSRS